MDGDRVPRRDPLRKPGRSSEAPAADASLAATQRTYGPRVGLLAVLRLIR
jgi:hypothetical protein